MDIASLRETVLVLALIAFCGIVWWAYAPTRRARFERDGLSVFDDERRDAAVRTERAPAAIRRRGG